MNLTDKPMTSNKLTTALWTLYARFFCGRELSIQTHLTLREKILLMQLAHMRRGTNHVEIGSYLGASACFISRGIRLASSNPEARLFCVDTWMNDAMTEGQRDTYQEFSENTRSYDRMIVPLRARSEEAAAGLLAKVDFLFVDGDHSYEGVSNDIRSWFPKLSAGAVAVFHDYGWAEGVQRAVAELVKPLEVAPGHVLDNTYWTIIR